MSAALTFLVDYGLPLGLYGGAAILAAWQGRRDADLRWTGYLLLGSFIVTNALWFFGDVEQRPGIYSCLQIGVAVTAYLAWLCAEPPAPRWRQRCLAAIVGFAALYICVNIAFAATYVGEIAQLNLHEIGTNIIFLLECLSVVAIRVADGVRSNRIGRSPSLGRDALAADAVTRGASE